MPKSDDARPVVEKALERLGLELYELKYINAGAKSVLKVFIDKPGGITVEDCENASRDISMHLDVEEFSKSPYRLEVSSPGIDRDLITEKDYSRVVGRNVKISVNVEGGKKRVVTGKLQGCKNGVITIETKSDVVTLNIDESIRGKVDILF